MADTIRSLIAGRLEAIDGIGLVHTYQRYAAREKQLADLYSDSGQLCGWFIRRLSQRETYQTTSANIEETKWLIRGYLAIDDANASELAFDALLDAVRDAFRAPIASAGVLTRPAKDELVGVSIEEQAPVLFAGVLCHSVRCVLVVKRYVETTR